MVDYFTLMGLPKQFELDTTQLQANYRAWQRRVHPDINPIGLTKSEIADLGETNLIPQAASMAALNADQQAALINTAYQTLANPASRAEHLLQLVGISVPTSQSLNDVAFLQRAMELRIELEEANTDHLPHLQQQLVDWIATISQQFAQQYSALLSSSFTDNQPLVTASVHTVQQLQFLVKLSADVAKQYDVLAQTGQSDDDLYV